VLARLARACCYRLRGFARTYSELQYLVSNKSTILRKLLKKLILLLLVLINSKIGKVKIIMKNAATVVLIFFVSPEQFGFWRYEDLHGHRRY